MTEKICTILWLMLATGWPAHSAPAAPQQYRIRVTAGPHGCYSAPVRVRLEVPGSPSPAGVRLSSKGRTVPAQLARTPGGIELTWIVANLKPSESRDYTARLENTGNHPPTPKMAVVQTGRDLEISAGGELIARYDATHGPNKPYFFPLNAPGGRTIVRSWPVEQGSPASSHDHPHHRGLWFTHGDVNGVDYWSEGKGTGSTRCRGYEDLESGPVYAHFRTGTDWVDPSGKKVAEDVRDVTVYDTPAGWLMDFNVTVHPSNGPLTFGDTKEGSFGLRVADTMRVTGGNGHILTSAGVTDRMAWGTRADWVDYYGPVGGAEIGIAIMDHPQNLRHPTYWHVRDYGLFAANPFGIHEFVKGAAPHSGDFTLQPGSQLTLRYRVLLHKGGPEQAHVPDVWWDYAEPPTVSVR
ncbi:MAG: PmoA family protein [Chthonomonadales bacterium]